MFCCLGGYPVQGASENNPARTPGAFCSPTGYQKALQRLKLGQASKLETVAIKLS